MEFLGGIAPLRRRLAMKLSQRTALVCFVLTISLVLAAFSAREIAGARRQVLRNAATGAENLAGALSIDVLDTLQTADSTLAVTVNRLENDPGLLQNLPQLRPFLIGQAKEVTAAWSITLYDGDGNWVADSLLLPPERRPLMDRGYLTHIRTHEERAPHVGTLRRDPQSGRFVLPLMRRINNRDGSLGGIASLAIDLGFFQRRQEGFALGPGDRLTLYLEDGTVLARHPATTRDIGLSAANGPVFERLRAASAGSFVAGPVSGDPPRLVAYRRLPDYPLVVSAALATDGVLAGWRTDTIRKLIILSAAVLAILFLGITLGREIGRREEAETALRATERRFRETMLGFTDLAIIAFDRPGTIILVNHAAERLLGYRAEELVGKATPLILPGEEALWARAAEPGRKGGTATAGTAIAGGEEHDWTLRAKDGREMRARLSLAAIRDEAGESAGFIAVIRDLAERRQAQAEALRFRHLLDDTVESVRDRVLLYDAENRLVLANRAFRETEGKYTGPLEPGAPMREILRRFLTATRAGMEPAAIEGLVTETLAADRLPNAPPTERRLPDGSRSLVRSFATGEGGVLIVATAITAPGKAALPMALPVEAAG